MTEIESWRELSGDRIEFTIRRLPSVAVAFDADNPGRWAVHCHLAYHQAAGMFATIRYV